MGVITRLCASADVKIANLFDKTRSIRQYAPGANPGFCLELIPAIPSCFDLD
jgi:hypothetical protein